MNILYINPIGFISGAENSLLGIIDSLDSKKFTPLIMVPDASDFFQYLQNNGYSPIPFNPAKLRVVRPLSYLRTLFFLRKILIKKKIDLVHINSCYGVQYIPVKWLVKIPIVLHFRNEITLRGENLYFLKQADLVIANSNNTRSHILSYYNNSDKVITIYNGVDLNKFSASSGLRKKQREIYSIPHDSFVFGFVGQPVPHKGLMDFVKFGKKIITQYPDCRFLICGELGDNADEKYKKEVLDYINSYGLKEYFIIAGFCEKMEEIYPLMDVLVVPSLREPFGRVVIEANAAGLPVIASRVGGIKEIIIDNKTGLLVTAGNVDEFVEAGVTLLRNRELASKYGRAGRERVINNFDNQTITRQIEKNYIKLGHPG